MDPVVVTSGQDIIGLAVVIGGHDHGRRWQVSLCDPPGQIDTPNEPYYHEGVMEEAPDKERNHQDNVAVRNFHWQNVNETPHAGQEECITKRRTLAHAHNDTREQEN